MKPRHAKVDLRVKVRMQNAHLARIADKCGSVRGAAEAVGVCPGTYSAWLNFRHSLNVERRPKASANILAKLCELGECEPEDLFPELTAEDRAILSKAHSRDISTDTARLTADVESQYLTYDPDLSSGLVAGEATLKVMESMKACLSDREYAVLRMRYGFDGEPLTLLEVGRELGVTRERVRQIEKKAVRKLRQGGFTLLSTIDDFVHGGACRHCGEWFRNENARNLHEENCGND